MVGRMKPPCSNEAVRERKQNKEREDVFMGSVLSDCPSIIWQLFF